MLNRRILDFTLKSTECSENVLIAAEYGIGFLATLQHSFDNSLASLHRAEERYNRNIDRIPSNGRERIIIGIYVFMYVLDDVKKTPKFGRVFQVHYQVLVKEQHTEITQRKEFIDRKERTELHLPPPSPSRFNLSSNYLKQDFGRNTMDASQNLRSLSQR